MYSRPFVSIRGYSRLKIIIQTAPKKSGRGLPQSKAACGGGHDVPQASKPACANGKQVWKPAIRPRRAAMP
jgi:hypothetical protein